MNRKISLILISSLLATNYALADIGFSSMSDFTGESFFLPATEVTNTNNDMVNTSSSNEQSDEQGMDNKRNSKQTIPPVKKIRLMIQDKIQKNEYKKREFAPTSRPEEYMGAIETSEYASKEIKEEFDDDYVSPDGFEADDESMQESKKEKKGLFRKKSKKNIEVGSEDIILDCENINYDTDNYLVLAKGNVNVEFVKQKIQVKADTITFDRLNNTIKAEGNVRIVKGNQVVNGDYIFVDMNEENALIENPITESANILMHAEKGYVYGDKIVQEHGEFVVNNSFPINLASGNRGPRITRMLIPKSQTITDDMENGRIKVKAQEIRITQKDELETLAFKRLKISKDQHTILKLPSIKFYTNKNHEYVETSGLDIGYYRGLGLYTGPGWVMELPKGSVFKVTPALVYKSGAGIGGVGRFHSGTNQTMIGYGTPEDRLILLGEQKLDDNLKLLYASNAYMDEWFLGRRRPKYGVGLVYSNEYNTENFLLKDKTASFKNRVDLGYYQNTTHEKKTDRIRGSNMGTTRLRYMAQANQNLYKYKNKEKLTAFSFDIVSQLSAAVYGTGDTQVIGRLGPMIHTQYKRWMQDIGYYFSAYDDNSPISRYDAYRYGKQNLYLRESIRLNRYLALSWIASINMTNDAPNNKDLQENSFYVSFGPDDLKFSVGYDFIRENMYCNVEVMMDAKGANVEYDRFEITQAKKADKKPKKETKVSSSKYMAPTEPKLLKNAIVEDVKVMDDVL